MNIIPSTNESVLEYVLANTDRERMSDVSTRQVAAFMGVSTSIAFDMLNELAKQKKITKLDPANGDKFSCCGWIANT